MARQSEQERGDWTHEWPEDGEQCPECSHGMIEVQSFGHPDAPGYEVHAFCVGLNGTKLEDASEDEEGDCGCGWSGIYHPNRHNEPSTGKTD